MHLDLSRLILAALITLCHHIFRIEQVSDRIQIYLLERNSNSAHFRVTLQLAEDLVDSPWYDSMVLIHSVLVMEGMPAQAVCAHSVRLTATGLTVGEDANIMTV